MKKFWNDNNEQRVHMVGEYVGVCCNFDWEQSSDGMIRKKTGTPYIDAWKVYGIDQNGIGDVGRDHPLQGGLQLDLAKQIHNELGAAIEYLESLG